jgi:transcriptional regulator with XRE-family HTH domain
LTQLLSGHSLRLPRADTLRRIAERYSVSLDWLLGLSQDETLAAEIRPALEIAVAVGGADNDTLLERWHKEAIGYKIRYVPAQVPDLLRTPGVIEYEYSGRTAPSPSWQLRNAEFRLDYSRRPETDMEVCMPRQRLELLAEGRGHWRRLDRDTRETQLTYMANLVDELYPLHDLRPAAGGDLRRRDVPRDERDGAHPLTHPPLRQFDPPRRRQRERERGLHPHAQGAVRRAPGPLVVKIRQKVPPSHQVADLGE